MANFGTRNWDNNLELQWLSTDNENNGQNALLTVYYQGAPVDYAILTSSSPSFKNTYVSGMSSTEVKVTLSLTNTNATLSYEGTFAYESGHSNFSGTLGTWELSS